MDYKTEMRNLIDIVKQQSFDAPLESTLEDLTTLSAAVKDLSDRINTRTKKSLDPNDIVKAKKKSQAKKVNIFFLLNRYQYHKVRTLLQLMTNYKC